MGKRLTWEEIVKKYPDQWVGLTDVDWENESNVRTAIVKYSDKTPDELYDLQLQSGEVYTTYTTPNTFPYGQVMMWAGEKQ